MKKVFAILVLSLFVSACIPGRQTATPQPADVAPREEQQSGDASQIELADDVGESTPEISLTATESGRTAFVLLQEGAEVEYEEYDFGVFIQSINDMAGDNEHYWAIYVNDEYSQTGADQTVLEAGDVVTFRFELIEDSNF